MAAGAAITIGISQLKYLGNLDIPRRDTALTNFIEVRTFRALQTCSAPAVFSLFAAEPQTCYAVSQSASI